MILILSDTSLTINSTDERVRYFDLTQLKIGSCTGCFGCWIRTPGKCVIRDDAVRIYPLIAQCDKLIYVSRIRYGSYDTPIKTMLERAIPVQQAFIRLHGGETHHVQRNVLPKSAKIVAYGEPSEKEKDIFKRLIARNALNMCFDDHEILFSSSDKLDEIVNREVNQWLKSY